VEGGIQEWYIWLIVRTFINATMNPHPAKKKKDYEWKIRNKNRVKIVLIICKKNKNKLHLQNVIYFSICSKHKIVEAFWIQIWIAVFWAERSYLWKILLISKNKVCKKCTCISAER
jgi:hypothetical protein